MFVHETLVRVRYGETDRMGFVYYGDYAEYFEVGRVEALRALGFSYRSMEDKGVMLPVREMYVRYHAPARYDDLLTVRTTIPSMPGARITFRNEVLAGTGDLLTEATITLVFVGRDTGRPCRPPEEFVRLFAPYFVT